MFNRIHQNLKVTRRPSCFSYIIWNNISVDFRNSRVSLCNFKDSSDVINDPSHPYSNVCWHLIGSVFIDSAL